VRVLLAVLGGGVRIGRRRDGDVLGLGGLGALVCVMEG
jgi:hypothetical protein